MTYIQQQILPSIGLTSAETEQAAVLVYRELDQMLVRAGQQSSEDCFEKGSGDSQEPPAQAVDAFGLPMTTVESLFKEGNLAELLKALLAQPKEQLMKTLTARVERAAAEAKDTTIVGGPVNRIQFIAQEAALTLVANLFVDPLMAERTAKRQAKVTMDDGLRQAILKGDFAAYEARANQPDVKLGGRDIFGYTELMLAVLNGEPKILEDLLARGAEVNAVNSDEVNGRANKMTALHYAVSPFNEQTWGDGCTDRGDVPENTDAPAFEAKRVQCIQRLIAAGADLKAADRLGHTPLHRAISTDNEAFVAAILQGKPDPNFCGKRSAPLTITSYQTGQRVVEKIEYAPPPLLQAIETGNTNIVKQLLEAGADATAIDYEGQTTIMKALDVLYKCMNTDMIELLLNYGADKTLNVVYHNRFRNSRTTALQMAQKGRNGGCIRLEGEPLQVYKRNCEKAYQLILARSSQQTR